MKEYCEIIIDTDGGEVALTNKKGQEKHITLTNGNLYYTGWSRFICEVSDKENIIEEKKQEYIKECEKEAIRYIKTTFGYAFGGYKVIEDIKINTSITTKYAKDQTAKWCIEHLTIEQLISQFGEVFIK